MREEESGKAGRLFGPRMGFGKKGSLPRPSFETSPSMLIVAWS